MAPSNIYVTLVRPGKPASHQEVPSGSTVQDVLNAVGIPTNDYRNWSFTDEDGDSLTLNSRLDTSTAIICGTRVDGAA